ncbi:MAG: hypothetical protein AB7R69_00055 [Candidatus Babeliales bacterium]
MKKYFFIALLFFSTLSSIESAEQTFPLEHLPLNVQNYLSPFLDWERFVETDEKLERLAKGCTSKLIQGISTHSSRPSFTELATNKFSIKSLENTILNIYNNKGNLGFQLNSKEFIFSFKVADQAEIISFNICPQGKFLCILLKNKESKQFFEQLNLADQTSKTYNLPEELLDIWEFATGGKQYIALATNTGIHLLDIAHNNKQPPYTTLEEHEEPELPSFRRPVIKLEFNKQITKLAANFYYGASKNYESTTKIIPLPQTQEFPKTLQEYFRLAGICKNLKHAGTINNSEDDQK